MKDLLIEGETLEFANEDSSVWMNVFHFDGGGLNAWATGFKIEFNGKIIDSAKTFKGVESKINALCKKWSLKRI